MTEEYTMSFRIQQVVAFAEAQNLPQGTIDSIKARAREAAQDYPGRDGDEFAHSRLAFVLGRDLASKFQKPDVAPARVKESA